MNGGHGLRLLRGAIGNAIVWGACWCVATFAVFGVMALVGAQISWSETWRLAARLSVIGGLSGAAFSLFIGLAYRGRRLSDLNWLRFGLGGGVVAGLFVPGFMLVMRTIAGDGPLALHNYLTSGLIAAAFGSVAAGASLKVAQRADQLLPTDKGVDQLEP